MAKTRKLWDWYVKQSLDIMMFFLVIAIGSSFMSWIPIMVTSIVTASVSLIVSLKYGRAGEDGSS